MKTLFNYPTNQFELVYINNITGRLCLHVGNRTYNSIHSTSGMCLFCDLVRKYFKAAQTGLQSSKLYAAPGKVKAQTK